MVNFRERNLRWVQQRRVRHEGVQYGRVQDEKRVIWKKKETLKKCNMKKVNMKKLQRKKSVIWEKWNFKWVQHEKSEYWKKVQQ